MVRAMPNDPPSASLGLPVPIARGTAGEAESGPALLPPAYQTAPLVEQPLPNGVEPIATVPPPGTVIATSHHNQPLSQPTHAEPDEQPPSDLFAADRPEPARPFVGVPPVGSRPGPEILQVGNWTEKYPITAAPPLAPPAAPGPVAVPPGSASSIYVSAEYLLWAVKRDRAPVLATTGDQQNGAAAGRLGNADTLVLFNGAFDSNAFSGGRFTVGYFLDESAEKAIEVTGFFLGPRSDRFTTSSAMFPVIARPFFSLNEGIERVEFTAIPGQSSGTLRINAPSQLWGMEANFRCPWCCGCDYRIDMLAGFRFLSLKEQIEIIENVQTVPGLADPFNGTPVIVRDSFATNNQFYGGQIGIAGQKRFGHFTLEAFTKLALGDTHQTVTIQGSQTFPPGTPNVDPRPGGLLALDSNIGHFTRDRFAVVPEVGLTVGYFLTDNVQVTLGYNFLYWSSVVRPGDQIDRNLDVNRIPNFTLRTPVPDVPGAHPAVLFKDTDFWAQGLTLGIKFVW
jgi:hypothetical protein